MQQQANLANQSAQNTAGQFNAGAQNTAGQYNAGAQNAVSLANQAAMNSGGQFNAQLMQALQSNDWNRQVQALGLLGSIGSQQQGQLQNIINIPRQALSQYASLVPGQYPTTTSTVGTAPNTAPGIGQQILGGGLTLLGLGTGGGTTIGGRILGGLF